MVTNINSKTGITTTVNSKTGVGGVTTLTTQAGDGDPSGKDWLDAGVSILEETIKALGGKVTDVTPPEGDAAPGMTIPGVKSILTSPSPIGGIPWWMVGAGVIGAFLLFGNKKG